MSRFYNSHFEGATHFLKAECHFTTQAALNELSARGALVVASSGNDGQNTDATPHYPSSLPDDIILSVGASTRQNALW